MLQLYPMLYTTITYFQTEPATPSVIFGGTYPLKNLKLGPKTQKVGNHCNK